jgi:hypothetical protein
MLEVANPQVLVCLGEAARHLTVVIERKHWDLVEPLRGGLIGWGDYTYHRGRWWERIARPTPRRRVPRRRGA